ncbi:insulin-like [Argiope bruennichi]|nr:insulin-like [Argiope bruennichi]
MDLRRSMFFGLGFLVLSVLYSDNAEGVRMCGRRLADLLNFVCGKHGGFHAPRTAREVSNRSSNKTSVVGLLSTLSRRTLNSDNQGTAEIEMTSNLRGGVVDECCRKQCSFTTLLSYCADSQHVGNIDLEEMVPPGSEPAISAEDIAEFHDGMTESSALLSPPASTTGFHSSRPNLGQFMRNRPVFIVLSQLQEDEDRSLGDYRF